MTLLMPRQRRPGHKPDTPPTGRVPTADHVPEVWRGIGGLRGERPPTGTVYGRTLRKRALIRLGWMVLVVALLIVGVVVAAVSALAKMLVL